MPRAVSKAELLHAAAGYVKPGGWLCFSTCTVTHAENQQQVKSFLAAHSGFQLSPLSGLLPLLPAGEEKHQAEQGMLQLLPDEQGGEGFFISLMQKSG